MGKILLILLGFVFVLVGVGFLFMNESDKNFITINGNQIEVEIMRTPEEQTRGLSGKESLAGNAGMLFVYEESLIPSFWMKDMNFPLDIIWIGEDKKIVDITENISPETFPNTFKPKVPVQYVLEVSAGWAESHAIEVGEAVKFENDIF